MERRPCYYQLRHFSSICSILLFVRKNITFQCQPPVDNQKSLQEKTPANILVEEKLIKQNKKIRDK